MTKKVKTSAILLAGGMGTRMKSATPKQFLAIDKRPLAIHSFEIFLQMPEIDEIIVVCLPDFRDIFTSISSKHVLFALPGLRRQDSVFNGFQLSTHNLICIHDAARPFIDKDLVLRVLVAGSQYGAATAALPIKFTIKESDSDNFVTNTPDRNIIWEIQTPQVIHRDILEKGFTHAIENNLTVNDDVSLAELIGMPVKLISGSHSNLKVTVPTDLLIAQQLLKASKQ